MTTKSTKTVTSAPTIKKVEISPKSPAGKKVYLAVGFSGGSFDYMADSSRTGVSSQFDDYYGYSPTDIYEITL